MSYYFLHEQKKMPGWLAYGAIGVLVVVLGVFLNSRSTKTSTITRASKALEPKNLTISNLAANSFSISFESGENVTAQIKYGAGEPDIVKFDDRDNTNPMPRRIHYFTIQNLIPLTSYTFHLIIDGKELTTNHTARTLPSNVPATSSPPLFGKVTKNNLEPSADTLVTVTLSDAQNKATFSTLTKETGEWIVTTPYLASEQGVPLVGAQERPVAINFTDGTEMSNVSVAYQNASPLTTVILGKDYQLEVPTRAPVSGDNNSPQTLTILYPSDNSVISAQHPVFRGLAPANSSLQIIVQPNIESVVILSDSYGEWKYETKAALAPGKYQFFVKSSVENKIEIINFYIPKSGESVLGDATGSATITPTRAPTTAPTSPPTPTRAPSITPTGSTSQPTATPGTDISATPTTAPVTPTGTASPSPTAMPTVTQNQIPVAGGNNFIVITAASAISLLGLLLVLY